MLEIPLTILLLLLLFVFNKIVAATCALMRCISMFSFGATASGSANSDDNFIKSEQVLSRKLPSSILPVCSPEFVVVLG